MIIPKKGVCYIETIDFECLQLWEGFFQPPFSSNLNKALTILSRSNVKTKLSGMRFIWLCDDEEELLITYWEHINAAAGFYLQMFM